MDFIFKLLMIVVHPFIQSLYRIPSKNDTLIYFNKIFTQGIKSINQMSIFTIVGFVFYLLVSLVYDTVNIQRLLRVVIMISLVYTSYCYNLKLSHEVECMDSKKKYTIQCRYFIVIISIHILLLMVQLIIIINSKDNNELLHGIMFGLYFTTAATGFSFIYKSFFLTLYLQIMCYAMIIAAMIISGNNKYMKFTPITLVVSTFLLMLMYQIDSNSIDAFLTHQKLQSLHQNFIQCLENANNPIALLKYAGNANCAIVEFLNKTWAQEPLLITSIDEIIPAISTHTIKGVGSVKHAIDSLLAKCYDNTVIKESFHLEITFNSQTYHYKIDISVIYNNEFKMVFLQYIDNTMAINLEQHKLRCKMICSISHEILTPMNSILYITEKLSQTNTLHEQYSLLHSNANLLYLKLLDFICYSELASGRILIRNSFCSIRSIINKLSALYMEEIKSKNITVYEYYDANLPELILCDQTRIMQIVNNILSNAIKYSNNNGTIKITILTTIPYISIHIEDDGQGFQTSTHDKLAGVGLEISQQICKAIGSNLKINSKKGKGSRFSFDVQRTDASSTLIVPQEIKSCEDFSLKHIRLESRHATTLIMIVDDVNFNRITLKLMITKLLGDVHCMEACNGKEAYDMLIENMMNFGKIVVFMDIDMPIMDGPTATAKMIENFFKIKPKGVLQIVGITAFISKNEIQKGIDSGMIEVYTKPISISELKECLITSFGMVL